MAIENDPSARMQLRTRGELVHPGTCMVCGSGVCDEGYLDLGVFFDYEGTMYLCYTCVTQAGETIGMFTPEQVDSQKDLLEELTRENARYKEELDRVRPLISAFEHAYSLATPSDSNVVDFVREESESVPESISGEPDNIDSNDSSVTEGSGDGESEPSKPVKVTKRTGTSGTSKRDITF